MKNGIRTGFVSSYNSGTGMASVYYPDRNGETTGEMPVLAPFGVAQALKKGEMVLVLHLSNGGEAGIVLGPFSAAGSVPGACIENNNGGLALKDASGSISVAELVAIREAHRKE